MFILPTTVVLFLVAVVSGTTAEDGDEPVVEKVPCVRGFNSDVASTEEPKKEGCECGFKLECGASSDSAESKYISIDMPWKDPYKRCSTKYRILVMGTEPGLISDAQLYARCGANVTIACGYDIDTSSSVRCGAFESDAVLIIPYMVTSDRQLRDTLHDDYIMIHGHDPDLIIVPGGVHFERGVDTDTGVEFYTRDAGTRDGDFAGILRKNIGE